MRAYRGSYVRPSVHMLDLSERTKHAFMIFDVWDFNKSFQRNLMLVFAGSIELVLYVKNRFNFIVGLKHRPS
jgi:hypothetical protein